MNSLTNRVTCSFALTLLLFGCNVEERPATPAVDTTPTTTTTTTTTTTAAATDTTPAAASPAPAAPAVPADHDVTGAYFPIDALPRDFAEIEHLSLATIDENAAPAPLNGFLRPRTPSAPDYALVKPSIEGRRLTFETTEHGGVHYAFEGEFLVLGKFPENPPSYETVVLSGTLRRIRQGQTVASTPVRFRYEAGG